MSLVDLENKSSAPGVGFEYIPVSKKALQMPFESCSLKNGDFQ